MTIHRPIVVAHRCGNDISDAGLAARQGADVVEIDVHMTKDACPVVQQNPGIVTESGFTYLASLALDDLQRERSNAGLRPILLLDEVLEQIRPIDIGVMVDIKNGPIFYEGLGERVMGSLLHCGIRHEKWIVSFDHECIRALASNGSREIGLGILVGSRLANLAETIRFVGANLISVQNRFLTQNDISKAHDSGALVCGALENHPRAFTEYMTSALALDYVSIDGSGVARVRSRWPGT